MTRKRKSPSKTTRKRREQMRRYAQTADGIAAQNRYNHSPLGLDRSRRYRLGPKYGVVKRRYQSSPKGLDKTWSRRHGRTPQNPSR